MHTLPAEKSTSSEDAAVEDGGARAGQSDAREHEDEDDLDSPPPEKKQRLSPVTDIVPRLISIVEIVKREWVTLMLAQKKEGKIDSEAEVGLHQWNEVGCLEDLKGDVEEEQTEADRAEALLLALEGKRL